MKMRKKIIIWSDTTFKYDRVNNLSAPTWYIDIYLSKWKKNVSINRNALFIYV